MKAYTKPSVEEIEIGMENRCALVLGGTVGDPGENVKREKDGADDGSSWDTSSLWE